MAKKKNKKQILCVQILEAKPNKLFTEEQRQSIRFLRYNQTVKCAECGKKRKVMWTMLYQFRCANMESLVCTKGKISHLPLTPVCSGHPLAPDWPDEKVDQ